MALSTAAGLEGYERELYAILIFNTIEIIVFSSRPRD